MVEPMPFFITRVVATVAARDRASPRVMTAASRPFATHAEAEAAARTGFAGEECHTVEANTPADALRKILPELDFRRGD
jgi:hypothetical protein